MNNLDYLKNYGCIMDFMSFKLLNAALKNPSLARKLQNTAMELKRLSFEMQELEKLEKIF